MNKLSGRCERASLNRLRNISDFQSNFNQTRVQSNEVQKRCSSYTITESILSIRNFCERKKSHRLSTSHITINKSAKMRVSECVCSSRPLWHTRLGRSECRRSAQTKDQVVWGRRGSVADSQCHVRVYAKYQ